MAKRLKTCSELKHTYSLPFGASDTGFFSSLPLELVSLIFILLPLEDRIACVSQVCKSWRSLLQFSSLWRAIGPSPKHSLISQIPKGCIAHFSLSAKAKEISSQKAQNLVRLLIENQHLNIKSLKLSGTSITVKVLRSLKPLLYENLDYLEIVAVHGSLNIESSVPILANATKVRHLKLGFDAPFTVESFAQFMKPFKNSLRTLTLCNVYFAQPDSLLETIGEILPNLEMLTFEALRITEPSIWTHERNISPLPNLKVFVVCNLISSSTYYEYRCISSQTVTNLFQAVLNASNNLRSIYFSRGRERVPFPRPQQTLEEEQLPRALPTLLNFTLQSSKKFTNLISANLGFLNLSSEFLRNLFFNCPDLQNVNVLECTVDEYSSSHLPISADSHGNALKVN